MNAILAQCYMAQVNRSAASARQCPLPILHEQPNEEIQRLEGIELLPHPAYPLGVPISICHIRWYTSCMEAASNCSHRSRCPRVLHLKTQGIVSPQDPEFSKWVKTIKNAMAYILKIDFVFIGVTLSVKLKRIHGTSKYMRIQLAFFQCANICVTWRCKFVQKQLFSCSRSQNYIGPDTFTIPNNIWSSGNKPPWCCVIDP